MYSASLGRLTLCSMVVLTALLAACATTDSRPGTSGTCAFECEGFELCCTDGCKAINDPANCGMCGRSCAAGQSCVSGECQGTVASDGGGGACSPDCSSTQRCCGGGCVNRSVAPGTEGRSDLSFQNCGGCGLPCDPMKASACSMPAASGGAPSCVCGNGPACSGSQMCINDSGTFRCANTGSDRMNCGSIGNACNGDERCVEGVCRCGTGDTCGDSTLCCEGSCVDNQEDDNNCGSCGFVCPGNAPNCNGGECGCGVNPACEAPGEGGGGGLPIPIPIPGGGGLGESCCEGSCVPNDDANCGCGVACDEDDECMVNSSFFPGLGGDEGGICCGNGFLCTGGGFPGLPGAGDGGLPIPGGDGGLPIPIP